MFHYIRLYNLIIIMLTIFRYVLFCSRNDEHIHAHCNISVWFRCFFCCLDLQALIKATSSVLVVENGAGWHSEMKRSSLAINCVHRMLVCIIDGVAQSDASLLKYVKSISMFTFHELYSNFDVYVAFNNFDSCMFAE